MCSEMVFFFPSFLLLFFSFILFFSRHNAKYGFDKRLFQSFHFLTAVSLQSVYSLLTSDLSKAFLQPSTDCHVKITGDEQVLKYPDQPSGSNVTFKVTEITNLMLRLNSIKLRLPRLHA